MNLSKLWEIVKDRGNWHAAVNGITKSQTWLSEWTTIKINIYQPNKFSITIWHLPEVLATCLYKDWIICCCSCWLSTPPEGVESTNEALCALGNCQDRSLDSRYSQELILWAQFLYLLLSRKVLKSFMVTIISHDYQKLYDISRNFLQKKKGLDCINSPFNTITYTLTFPPTSLEQFLRGIWGAVS